MKKTTLLAVGAFAVLLAAVLLTRETQVNEGVPKLLLPKVEAAKVTGLELSGAASARLTYEDGKWLVWDGEKKYAADDAAVKGALGQLERLKATDFVTQKAEKHGELEVDDAKGLHLKVHGITPELDVVLGKNGRDGAYLREAKSSAVFVAPGFYAASLKKNVSQWRKKQIATFTAADVTRLSVAPAGQEPFVVERKGDKLELTTGAPKGFRYDSTAAERLLNQLASLTAQDFGTEKPAAASTFTATLNGGKTVTLHLGAKSANGTAPLIVDGDPQTYLLAGYASDFLSKGLDGLRDTRLLTADPAKVTSLTITSGKSRTVLAREAGAWKLLEPKTPPNGLELDLTQANAVVSRLTALRGSKAVFGIDEQKAGLKAPLATVELGIEGGAAQSLRFGIDASAGQAYVRGSADGLLYEAPAFERANLEKGVELFKKAPAAPAMNMAGLEQLPPELRQQLEAQRRQRDAQQRRSPTPPGSRGPQPERQR